MLQIKKTPIRMYKKTYVLQAFQGYTHNFELRKHTQ